MEVSKLYLLGLIKVQIQTWAWGQVQLLFFSLTKEL